MSNNICESIAINKTIEGVCTFLKKMPDDLIVVGFSDNVSSSANIDINMLLRNEVKKRAKSAKHLNYLFYYINNNVKNIEFDTKQNRHTNLIQDSKDNIIKNRKAIYDKLNNPSSSLFVLGHYKLNVKGNAYIDPNSFFANKTFRDGTKDMIFYVMDCNIDGELYFAKNREIAEELYNVKIAGSVEVRKSSTGETVKNLSGGSKRDRESTNFTKEEKDIIVKTMQEMYKEEYDTVVERETDNIKEEITREFIKQIVESPGKLAESSGKYTVEALSNNIMSYVKENYMLFVISVFVVLFVLCIKKFGKQIS